MDVTTTQSSTTSGVAVATPTSADEEAATDRVLSSDFETFLVMLTAQIENQDPLNPIDSTDYAVQLATFSGVEQQVLTNELLQQLQPANQDLGELSTYAGWVGMEARVAGQTAVNGAETVLSFDAPLGMNEGAVEIRSADGTLVHQIAVEGGDTELTWDGTDENGLQLPDGVYAVALSGKDANGGSISGEVHGYVRIAEARIGESGAELVITGGDAVAPGDISALREA